MAGIVHFSPKNMLPFFLLVDSYINDFVSFGVKTDKYQPMNDRLIELNCVSMDLLSKSRLIFQQWPLCNSS